MFLSQDSAGHNETNFTKLETYFIQREVIGYFDWSSFSFVANDISKR